ncbi:hypothetical protein [Klebsiella quasipneumoniae]|uniref:hypothetical protein n=1 Tax=Klebsiella quasipneumoniae TaxID=1463165 RepID=UPI00084C3FF1|nr:hypothetical protein [Klebsiella quasipneumoniae]MCL8071150.1 hypothetical protein [Klebsiella quasipneumoniae]MDE4782338.1 hypothetical protein [Klebsiella quasipneumoniae subsp. similipneumoniae]MDM7373318.1 hypothetical protein [Klebsiella quasipneumoniae]OED24554.1 hypothetical protein BCY82_24875 [Klebsiella quasipneumoniae]
MKTYPIRQEWLTLEEAADVLKQHDIALLPADLFRHALTRNAASQILQRKHQRDLLQGQSVAVPDDSDRRVRDLNHPQPDSQP